MLDAIRVAALAAAVLAGSLAPRCTAQEAGEPDASAPDAGTFVLKIRTVAKPVAKGPAAAGIVAGDLGNTIEGTHTRQERLSVIDGQGRTAQLQTFCLTPQGQVLAGCVADDRGELRLLNAEGKHLATWPLPVKPEAINTDPQGRIYVAGDGKLLKLDAQGKLLLERDAPHVQGMLANRKQLREQIVARYQNRTANYERSLQLYDDQIEKLTAKQEADQLSEAEEKRLEVYRRARTTMARYIEQQKEAGDTEQISEEQVEQQLKAMLAAKSKVSSISSTGDEVFLATGMTAGYGYQVYRMDGSFEDAVSIIQELRGCCGQMDVQANAAGVFVAENSRHRVAHFDHEGKEVNAWGSRDRTGETGFTSCCNPMNVCFGPDNCVLTAESTTGYIKQFDGKGKLLAHLGAVKLKPGCKKVSLAASPDGQYVYVLDITRSEIIRLSRPAEDEPAEDEPAKAETPAAAGAPR